MKTKTTIWSNEGWKSQRERCQRNGEHMAGGREGIDACTHSAIHFITLSRDLQSIRAGGNFRAVLRRASLRRPQANVGVSILLCKGRRDEVHHSASGAIGMERYV